MNALRLSRICLEQRLIQTRLRMQRNKTELRDLQTDISSDLQDILQIRRDILAIERKELEP